MALKIVHLCDVHSQKGEDIPAAFAHTLTLDGGTYAIDLCAACDSERFMPLAAFLDAFGMLTEGTVDPRAAEAENLRTYYATQAGAAPAPASSRDAPIRVRVRPVSTIPEPAPPEPAGSDDTTRSAAVLASLRAAPDGLAIGELTERTGISEPTLRRVLTPLRESGAVEFLARRWWMPEHVPADLRASLLHGREVVHERNATPRVCVIDGESLTSVTTWDDHCRTAHGAKPAEILGLFCPMDGAEFAAPQVLGMHGRTVHGCVHTPALFNLADAEGDPLGIIADIRAKFGKVDA